MTISTHKTPLAIFAYNRPIHVSRLLHSLVRCPRLDECDIVFFCDGPRNPQDVAATQATQAMIRSWLPRLPGATLRVRGQNMGLDPSVVSGVTELCREYGRVIVLEDDLMVSPDFVAYQLAALDRYADDDRVCQVSSYMFPMSTRRLPDTFFLPLITSWGWGTWDRAWRLFDWDCPGYAGHLRDPEVKARFDFGGARPYSQYLDWAMQQPHGPWDYRFNYRVFCADGLVLYPHRSLVWVGGWDCTGTHCADNPDYIQPPRLAFRGPRLARTLDFPATTTTHPEAYARLCAFFRHQHDLRQNNLPYQLFRRAVARGNRLMRSLDQWTYGPETSALRITGTFSNSCRPMAWARRFISSASLKSSEYGKTMGRRLSKQAAGVQKPAEVKPGGVGPAAVPMKTPLVIFAYNRPMHINRLLHSLIRCTRLNECDIVFFCDGPKTADDQPATRATQAIIKAWLPRLPGATMRTRVQNLGLDLAIVTGVTEVCREYGRVIVLEDDFMVSPDFVAYQLEALDRYADDARVHQVSAYIFPIPPRGLPETFFLPLVTSRGWGTWDRAWRQFDWDCPGYADKLRDPEFKARFDFGGARPSSEYLEWAMQQPRGPWDYRFNYRVFCAGGLVLYPHRSLVWVGGWDCSGTHCSDNPDYIQPSRLAFRGRRLARTLDFPATTTTHPEAYARLCEFFRHQHDLRQNNLSYQLLCRAVARCNRLMRSLDQWTYGPG